MTGMTLDQQIEALEAAYTSACEETAAEQGEEIVDGGGWVEIARAIVDLADPGITEEAKSEFCRMNGLERSAR
jgi:hypothetical protein